MSLQKAAGPFCTHRHSLREIGGAGWLCPGPSPPTLFILGVTTSATKNALMEMPEAGPPAASHVLASEEDPVAADPKGGEPLSRDQQEIQVGSLRWGMPTLPWEHRA